MSGLLRICTAGSVDDGKSTLIGRLLHDSQSVYEDQVHSVKAASKNRGDADHRARRDADGRSNFGGVDGAAEEGRLFLVRRLNGNDLNVLNDWNGLNGARFKSFKQFKMFKPFKETCK